MGFPKGESEQHARIGPGIPTAGVGVRGGGRTVKDN